MLPAPARLVPVIVTRAFQGLRKPITNSHRSHPILLNYMGNQAPHPLPPPPPVRRMPTSAANADQSDAPRAPGPNEKTREILGGQIQLLLSQTRDGAPAGFGKALDKLALDPQQPLSRRQCSLLLRAIKALPQDAEVSALQKQRRTALYDLTRAARAEAMLHEQIARHTERERSNRLPGAQRTAGTGGMVGVRFGLPGAVDAGAAVGARKETFTATFDDLTVATVRNAMVMAEASAQANVAPGVGVTGKVSGYSTEGDADISMSMRTRVLRLAHASVERRLGGNLLQRAFKRVTEPNRDRYDERASRAMAWQPKLPMLFKLPTAQPLAFGKRGLLISAGMTTHGAALDASVGYGVGELGARGAVTRTELRAALPTRLTELGEDGLPASNDPGIRSVLEARVSHRVGTVLSTCPADDEWKYPVMTTVRGLMKQPRDPEGIAKRLRAVADVRVAFEHLQALSDLSVRAPEHARAPLASLARDWAATGTAREPVMIAMLDTLAWLQAEPEPDAGPAHAQWSQLQRTVQAEARRIHDTTMPHNREWMKRATNAFREQTQRIASTSGTVSLTAALPLFSASGGVTVDRRVRQDPDPLRDGIELHLSFAADLVPSLGTLLSEVERQVPGLGALPVEQIKASIAPNIAALGVSGGMSVKVRLFLPTFQSDPEYGRNGCGSHVYSVRVEQHIAQNLDLTVPLPIAPGAAPTVNVHHVRENTTTLYERLSDQTLTSGLMRYQSKRSATTPAAETWEVMLEDHGDDLDRLAKTLTNPRSAPALEARYWLEREPATRTGASPTRRKMPDTSTLDAFKQPADRATRRDQLFALFEAVGAITSKQKAMSSLIGALTLPVVG